MQAQKQLLLHSLQGRGSDRLTNAELADLDTFCLDSVLMGYDGIEVPSSAAAGAKVGETLQLQCACGLFLDDAASHVPGITWPCYQPAVELYRSILHSRYCQLFSIPLLSSNYDCKAYNHVIGIDKAAFCS